MWSEVYSGIVEGLKSKLEALSVNGTKVFSAVYVGRKHMPEQFPCAYILPVTVRGTPASPQQTKYEMTFDIHVISRHPGSEEGFTDVVEKLGNIERMLVGDRSFGGLVENLEVDRIDLEVERPTVRERHEGRLRVRFERWLA